MGFRSFLPHFAPLSPQVYRLAQKNATLFFVIFTESFPANPAKSAILQQNSGQICLEPTFPWANVYGEAQDVDFPARQNFSCIRLNGTV
ncbi:MAG: hypothetical protein LUD69_05265 [Oscillospiraceae bacterium]|nr:hypothetical protein [Oscillospiraceae bacterium]